MEDFGELDQPELTDDERQEARNRYEQEYEARD